MFNDELYHFGILGMHWGIRRFQNKDGTLTKAGKNRVEKKSKSNTQNNDSFTLKKGTKVYRVANEDDDQNAGHQYVSVTDHDREQYGYIASNHGLFLDYQKSYGEHAKELTQDIRVKRGEKVVEDLIKKYGDKDSDSLMKDLDTYSNVLKRYKDSEKRSDYLEDFEDYDDEKAFNRYSDEYSAQERLNKFVTDAMKKHLDEVVTDYKNQNYDAIIDANDWIANIADMPLIMLDPATKSKHKSYTRYN